MNKEEFITKLQYALAGGVSGSQAAEHVRYYREYIDSEIHRGRTEEEVLAQLGEPRLLARSIIDANKRAGTAFRSDREYDEEAAGNVQEDDVYEQTGRVRRIMLPGWFIILIVVVAVVIVIGLVSSLLYLFAPVIMGVLIVMLVVKLIQGNRR